MIMYVKTPKLGSLNMRARPAANAAVIKKIPNGTILDAKIDGDWGQVTYDDTTGYVMVSYLTNQDPNITITKADLQKVVDGLQSVIKTIENILK